MPVTVALSARLELLFARLTAVVREVVLVAMLGVGVAEHSGFINAVLKTMLTFTPKVLLTPMVVFVAM